MIRALWAHCWGKVPFSGLQLLLWAHPGVPCSTPFAPWALAWNIQSCLLLCSAAKLTEHKAQPWEVSGNLARGCHTHLNPKIRWDFVPTTHVHESYFKWRYVKPTQRSCPSYEQLLSGFCLPNSSETPPWLFRGMRRVFAGHRPHQPQPGKLQQVGASALWILFRSFVSASHNFRQQDGAGASLSHLKRGKHLTCGLWLETK